MLYANESTGDGIISCLIVISSLNLSRPPPGFFCPPNAEQGVLSRKTTINSVPHRP
jgi:hypothetical protein